MYAKIIIQTSTRFRLYMWSCGDVVCISLQRVSVDPSPGGAISVSPPHRPRCVCGFVLLCVTPPLRSRRNTSGTRGANSTLRVFCVVAGKWFFRATPALSSICNVHAVYASARCVDSRVFAWDLECVGDGDCEGEGNLSCVSSSQALRPPLLVCLPQRGGTVSAVLAIQS